MSGRSHMIHATDSRFRAKGAMDDASLKRLHWRCRRGMLENDLVLERFLDRYGQELSERKVEAFSKLLDYADNELWDLVSRRSEPGDPDLVELVELLRSCWRGEQ